MTKHIGFYFLCMMAFLASCNNDDCPQEILLEGDLRVQESSLEFLELLQNKTFVFRDFFNNEMKLTSNSIESRDTTVDVAELPDCDGIIFWGPEGPTAVMNTEIHRLAFVDSQGQVVIRYDLLTQSLENPSLNEDSVLFDVLSILVLRQPPSGSELITQATGIVSDRGNEVIPEFSVREVQDTVINGRNYQNLLQFQDNKPILYSKEFGLLSLTPKSTKWNWHREE
ncbi:MAG: hypothetical protein MRZ79_23670 [Bacteroidia bacterium]|nr:hypothetical protein [Bacteroidia bacterium]